MADRVTEAVNALVDREPDKVEQARRNPHLVGWFFGQAMLELGADTSDFRIIRALERRGLTGWKGYA